MSEALTLREAADAERVEDGAVCLPRVREMARMIEAARVASEDDSTREMRRRMR